MENVRGEKKLILLGRYVKSCQLFCFVSQASNGQWYQMNDSSVSVSDIRSVLNQQAYVLFYIK